MQPNEKLREARMLKGWSQRRLADAVGTDEGRVSNWERGGGVGKQFQARMCEIFGMNAQELGFITCVGPTSRAEPSVEAPSNSAPQPVLQGIIGEAPNPIRGHDFYMLQRRAFLQQMFNLTSSAFIPLVGIQEVTSKTIEAMLPEIQGVIASCHRFMRGKDVAVVPSLLTMWLPVLDTMVKHPSKHQQVLMNLAAQGYSLAGIANFLQNNMGGSEWCYIQAAEYAHLADDPNLEATALKSLAGKYQYANMPLQMLNTSLKALPLVDRISPLLKSRTYLGLAFAYAQCEQHQKADRYLGLAHDTFPDDHQNDPCFAYADCGHYSFNHYGGLMYLLSGRAQKAVDTFAEIATKKDTLLIPERSILGFKNYQAEASIANNDKEQARDCLEAGAKGALELQSRRRFEDSLVAYKKALQRWPNDNELHNLEGLYEQGKGLWVMGTD